MYLKHYLNENGDRVYTLKVIEKLKFSFTLCPLN